MIWIIENVCYFNKEEKEMLGIGLGSLIAGAVSLAKGLGAIGLGISGLKMVANAIIGVAKALGLIKVEKEPKEMGDRALQAEEKGLTPDKCASYEDWVSKIEKDDWGYDPEKNKDMDEKILVEKGIEVASAVTVEKFPGIPVQDFFDLSMKNQEFFTVDRMDEIGKVAKNDVEGFGKVIKYIVGEAKDHATIADATDILMEIEKNIDPTISQDMAYDRVAGYKGL